MKTMLHATSELGQSIWLDTISRELLLKGLDAWIEKGVLGVTTNPAIFEQAIAKTTDYDEEIQDLAKEGKSVAGIYEILTLQEVRAAADVLRPVYDRTGGRDGYVSLEVNPLLASDVESTVSEAERLFTALGRPNVMIKVPATSEGVEAIEDCIARGININATLIFSMGQYSSVAESCLRGLERRVRAGESPDIASVASVFVSRVDSAVDSLLDRKKDSLQELKGHIAIDNARVIYQRYKKIFSPANPRWKALADRGARSQRPLWASTGTKNPAYSDVLYIESLVGPDTVNTIPPGTLSAFLEHGKAAFTLENDVEGAETRLRRLAAADINLDGMCLKLLQDGVTAFDTAFDLLLKSIAGKAKKQG
ncbi:MAG: transaldolase [Synergistaceae bacterium]|nr:transaldolase [Synergistaceae bacterium]